MQTLALPLRSDDDDFDMDFIQIHKTAKNIRKDIFNMSTRFTESFSSGCQETAVPQSLLTFVNMLLICTKLTSDAHSQPALSSSQLIMFNCLYRNNDFIIQKLKRNSIAGLSWNDGTLSDTKTRARVQIVSTWPIPVI